MRKSSLDPLLRTSALLLLTFAFGNADESTAFLERYCTQKAFGTYKLSDSNKLCTATFPIASNHLDDNQRKAECSKMSPMAVVRATGNERETECNYRQLGSCRQGLGTKMLMVSSTCLGIQYGEKPVTYDEAVQKCEKLGASLLLSNRHFFRFITEYALVENIDFQSYWFGRLSTENGKKMASVVYTGMRSLTLIRPGFTERVPATEKHHVVCMKSAERSYEDKWEDMKITSDLFGGKKLNSDDKHIYMLSRGVHQAEYKNMLTFANFDNICKGVVDGLAGVAAVPVKLNDNDMKTIIRDLPPISVPGRRSSDLAKAQPSSDCNGDPTFRENGPNYFDLVQGTQEGKVEVSWQTNYPNNKCADGDNTQVVMDSNGLMDAPFFVRNRVLCQFGTAFKVGETDPKSRCSPNADFVTECKCKDGYRDRGGSFKGQHCDLCAENLQALHVNIVVDATKKSWNDNSHNLQNVHIDQKDAVNKLASVFGKKNVDVHLWSYGKAGHNFDKRAQMTSQTDFTNLARQFERELTRDDPDRLNDINGALWTAERECKNIKGKKCVTVLITRSNSYATDCDKSLRPAYGGAPLLAS